MTTEDEFQALLDANPDDHQTRLVFADWLQERGDPRAEGYRALGQNRKRALCASGGHNRNPWIFGWDEANPNYGSAARKSHQYVKAQLPDDWYKCLFGVPKPRADDHWTRFPTRRAAEDAAAQAFTKLPDERRSELLAGPTIARRKPAPAKPKAPKRKTRAKPQKKPKGKKT